MTTPHDHPYADRPHRVYVALTNHCNRSCPWCSMFSSPQGSTFLNEKQFELLLPSTRPFEMQLEGGEPTVHPLFWRFVDMSRASSGCRRIIICSNGTRLPRDSSKLADWLRRIGSPYTLKISINHHLLDRDPGLLDLCRMLADLLPLDGGENLLVLNVRLRPGVKDDDSAVRRAVEHAGLLPWANVFFLQKYGFAKAEVDWSEPFIVGDNFTLINPDGRSFGTDLVTRSDAMGELP